METFVYLLFSAPTSWFCEKPIYVGAFFRVYYFYCLKAAANLESFLPPEEET